MARMGQYQPMFCLICLSMVTNDATLQTPPTDVSATRLSDHPKWRLVKQQAGNYVPYNIQRFFD